MPLTDHDAIRRAALAEVGRAPVADDPSMRALREALAGEPVLVQSPDARPAFWLVPFEVGDRACGVAHVDLSGRVVQVSRFGGGATDRASWPDAGFFRQPPPRVLEEVRTRHPDVSASDAMLSYDDVPAKWAWRIVVGGPRRAVAYITPGGWYEKPMTRDERQDREG